MKMDISRLQISPNYVLIDNMGLDFLLISFSKYFPKYHLKKNKGYATLSHINTILSNNITWFHRKSFKIKKCQEKRG